MKDECRTNIDFDKVVDAAEKLDGKLVAELIDDLQAESFLCAVVVIASANEEHHAQNFSLPMLSVGQELNTERTPYVHKLTIEALMPDSGLKEVFSGYRSWDSYRLAGTWQGRWYTETSSWEKKYYPDGK